MIEIQNDYFENIELNRTFGERICKKFFFNLKINRKLGGDNFLKIFEKNKSSFKLLYNFDFQKYNNFITELEKREEDNKIKRNNFKNKLNFSNISSSFNILFLNFFYFFH